MLIRHRSSLATSCRLRHFSLVQRQGLHVSSADLGLQKGVRLCFGGCGVGMTSSISYVYVITSVRLSKGSGHMCVSDGAQLPSAARRSTGLFLMGGESSEKSKRCSFLRSEDKTAW
jgi:hypothetical protein